MVRISTEQLLLEAQGAANDLRNVARKERALIANLSEALRASTGLASEAGREALAEKFREYLGDTIYSCSRAHEAWAHGTMGLDDFSLASEDEDIIESLVKIAAAAFAPNHPIEGEFSDGNM